MWVATAAPPPPCPPAGTERRDSSTCGSGSSPRRLRSTWFGSWCAGIRSPTWEIAVASYRRRSILSIGTAERSNYSSVRSTTRSSPPTSTSRSTRSGLRRERDQPPPARHRMQREPAVLAGPDLRLEVAAEVPQLHVRAVGRRRPPRHRSRQPRHRIHSAPRPGATPSAGQPSANASRLEPSRPRRRRIRAGRLGAAAAVPRPPRPASASPPRGARGAGPCRPASRGASRGTRSASAPGSR